MDGVIGTQMAYSFKYLKILQGQFMTDVSSL